MSEKLQGDTLTYFEQALKHDVAQNQDGSSPFGMIRLTAVENIMKQDKQQLFSRILHIGMTCFSPYRVVL